MADKKTFYITTTLPYVNADPHIGFAFELVEADIIARYYKLIGREVFFNTGTDEHGQKILQKAKEENVPVEEYVAEYAARFGQLQNVLDIRNNAFIRTTAPHHLAAAQELWRRCSKDIYKKKYKGLYCVGDEAFIKETDLVDGRCPNHPTMEPVIVEEENYFFKLSAYQKQLETYLSKPSAVMPEWRRLEALAFVQGGLEDFSISRVKEKMPWGVPVTGDDSQVMYVWFDALTNYISTLGWPKDGEGTFEKFWQEGEVVQLAGKDQVRFQSVMWQAMLISAGIKNTDTVVYHGFITSDGRKMSKSLGNVIDPFSLVEEYGTDALRYFFARHIHPFEDSDFTMEHFKEIYNANLANGLGNVAARVMQLAQTNLPEPVKVEFTPYPSEFTELLEKFEVNRAADYVWSRLKLLDQQITDTEPFKVIKTDPERGRELIEGLVRELAAIDLLIEPFMPQTSQKIIDAIVTNKKPETLFPRKE